MVKGDVVVRADHCPEGVANATVHDLMYVCEVKGRYTDCVYLESHVHVSHPTDKLVPAPRQ